MDEIYYFRHVAPNRPIPLMCCWCGSVCGERGLIYEKRAGWFTVENEHAVRVDHELTRIGECPGCQRAAAWQRQGGKAK